MLRKLLFLHCPSYYGEKQPAEPIHQGLFGRGSVSVSRSDRVSVVLFGVVSFFKKSVKAKPMTLKVQKIPTAIRA